MVPPSLFPAAALTQYIRNTGPVVWKWGWSGDSADGCPALPPQSSMPPPTCGSSTPRSTLCWCSGRGPVPSSRATSWQQGPPEEGSPAPTTWDPLPPSTFSGTCSLAPSTPCTWWQWKATSRATERPGSSPLVSVKHTHPPHAPLPLYPVFLLQTLCWKCLLWVDLQEQPFEAAFQQNSLGNAPCCSFWTRWQEKELFASKSF